LTSYNDGLNVNNNFDDDRNNNIACAGAPPARNFCLPFLVSFRTRALYPATEHAPNLVDCFLEGNVRFLIDDLDVMGKTHEEAEHVNLRTCSNEMIHPFVAWKVADAKERLKNVEHGVFTLLPQGVSLNLRDGSLLAVQGSV